MSRLLPQSESRPPEEKGPGASLEAACLDVLRGLVEQHSSARAIADAMGQAHNYVARILRGETKLRLDVLQRILETLGVSERLFFELATADRNLGAREILAFFGYRRSGAEQELSAETSAWVSAAERLADLGSSSAPAWSFEDSEGTASDRDYVERGADIDAFEALRFSSRSEADAGLAALIDGLFAEAESRAESACGAAVPHELFEDLAKALATWSAVRRLEGHRPDAACGFVLALDIARAGHSFAGRAVALHKAAYLLRDWEQSSASLLFLDWAADAYMRSGDTASCQLLYIDRAVVWVHLGDHGRAAMDYEVGLRYMPASTSSTYRIAALSGLSLCYRELGDLARAIAMNRAAEELFEGGRDLRLAYLVWNRGNLAAASRDSTLAVEALLAAMDLLAEFAEPLDVAFCSLDLAEVYMAEGRIGEIRRLADRVLAWLPALRGNRQADAAMMEWVRCVKWGEINRALLEASRSQLESSKHRA